MTSLKTSLFSERVRVVLLLELVLRDSLELLVSGRALGVRGHKCFEDKCFEDKCFEDKYFESSLFE